MNFHNKSLCVSKFGKVAVSLTLAKTAFKAHTLTVLKL
jgi:hypothetical protein